MKKCIRRIGGSALFLTGLAVLLLIASNLLRPRDNRPECGIHDLTANGILGEAENSVDILVVGDSESYSAISPMELWEQHGFTAYACGTTGQRLCETERFLRQAFVRQSPKLVILETNTIYTPVNIKNWLVCQAEQAFGVFKYHDRWKSFQIDDIFKPVAYTWTDALKGYSFSAAVNPAPEGEYMIPTEESEKIPEMNRRYVKSMAEFCQENGATLLLVSTPSPKNWNYERHNGIRQMADEYGLTYVDMNLEKEKVPINWATETRDNGDHLNYSGMVKATEFMGNYLKEHYSLPDHRNDKYYAEWDESLQQYNRVVGKTLLE